MFRPIEAIIRFFPMSYRSSIHIMCATVYQWLDLISVTCGAGISDLFPSGGGSHVDASCSGRVYRRYACSTSMR
jgi:hypothetical protein